MTSRATSEPSVPCTSKPVPANWRREGVVELGQQPGAEAQHGHDAVLEPARGHAGALAHGHGLDRVVAEHEAQRVGVVDGDVEDHAAAGPGVVIRQPCRCGGR